MSGSNSTPVSTPGQQDLFGGAPVDEPVVRPAVDTQVEHGEEPMIIRWMLRPGDGYESAGARFASFNRIQQPDKLSRSRIVGLVNRGLSSARDVFVVAANNAEGSAPLTLFELAKAVTN